MFQRIGDNSKFNLFYHSTNKFKTTTMRLFFKGSLSDHVEEQALLPSLLKRGSVRFPSLKDISRYLEALYGSGLSLDIAKMGEMQVFAVTMDMVNPRFIHGQPEILINGVKMMNDLLLNPLLEKGCFPKIRFEQERDHLQRYVKSVIDDKAVYTHIRLIKEMFKDEPYGNYEWGNLDKIPGLKSEDVYTFYKRLLATAPVDVYIVGHLTAEEERALPCILLPFEERFETIDPPETMKKTVKQENTIEEEQPVEQSKVEMGFRVNVKPDEDDFYALVLFNSILGGGAFSKLFKKVREEESMAYYIHSAYEKLKGFLYVSAGINTGNFAKVTDLVRKCMEEIKNGKISDEEFHNAKKSILNSLRSIADNPGQIIDFDFIAKSAGQKTDIQHISAIIDGMTKKQVAGVSDLIVPGTTFFLKGTGIR
ncbi:MAG: pitrilysin family protein [Planctomycetota bacterium]